MAEKQKTLDRIDELINYKLKKDHFDTENIREILTGIFGDSEIKFIYPHNLYRVEEDKVFYVFHGKFFSVVTKSQYGINVVTQPYEPSRLDYSVPLDESKQLAFLGIKLSSGETYIFDSSKDCIDDVKKTYTNLIHQIYQQTAAN